MLKVLAFLLALCLPASAQVPMTGAGKGAPGGGGGLDPATTAWIAAVGTAGGTVSSPRRTIVDTFIKCVKTASLWTTLDRYWLLAGEDAGSAKVDMANLQSFTVVSTPLFTASQGYDGIVAGPGNYINTNYNLSTNSVNYTLNSATVGMTTLTSHSISSDFPLGAADASFTNIMQITPTTGGPTNQYRVNQNTVEGGATAGDGQGSWYAVRTGASTTAAYGFSTLNSISGLLFSGTAASNALPNANAYILAISQGGSPAAWGDKDRVASTFFASGWNGTQVGNFESCQNAMMTSIGINVH